MGESLMRIFDGPGQEAESGRKRPEIAGDVATAAGGGNVPLCVPGSATIGLARRCYVTGKSEVPEVQPEGAIAPSRTGAGTYAYLGPGLHLLVGTPERRPNELRVRGESG